MLTGLLDDARAALTAAPREALGELREPRRLLGIARAPKIVPVGRAWHLGVLLLTDDGLLATGEIVRARRETPRGYTSESQRRRAELAGAASRGGFREGETVHIGWRMLDLDAVDRGDASDPLTWREGILTVRWSRAGDRVPLSGYLDERVALLLEPPAGA